MSHHNLEQISKATLILSCAGVFISPELIKTAKMCRLHIDMFGINGHPVPSSANSRFMEMLNKKDLIWELMFYYNPQFLHIGHFHYNVWKFPCNTVIVNRHITLWFSAIKWMCKQCKGLFLCDNLYFNKGDNSTLSVFQCALLHISSIYDTSLGPSCELCQNSIYQIIK